MSKLFSFTTNRTLSKWVISICIWIVITGTAIGDLDPALREAYDSTQVSAQTCTNSVSSFTYFDSDFEDVFNPVTPRESSATYKDYTINIYRGLGSLPSSLEVLHKNQFVYGRHANSLHFLADERIALGQDITGDGNPNMVIREWGGGAHGPHFFHIYELEPRFRFIQCIQIGNGSFDNLDADPAIELKVYDGVFSYLRSSYAGSPYIPVYLKYRDGAYRLALDIMRKAPLPPTKLSEIADLIRVLPEWKDPVDHTGPPPMSLWHEVIDLVYSGNLTQARILFHLSWPYYIEGRNEAWADFLERLSSSDYWKGIQEINGMN